MSLSILNVAQNFDADDDSVFKEEPEQKPIEQKIIKEEPKQEVKKEITPPHSTIETNPQPKKKDKEWTPDAAVLNEMPELVSKPVTYSKDEYIASAKSELRNLQDDTTANDAQMTITEMRTKNKNIDKVLKELGIKRLGIPDDNMEGKTYRFRILNAASDPKPERAEEKLKAIIQEMIKEFPEFVKTWEDSSKNKADAPVSGENIDEFITSDNEDDEPIGQPVVNSDELTIVIDKKDAPDVTFNEEELEKIRRARTIELQIVDDMELKFNTIEEEDNENIVESVLTEFKRKVKDVTVVLPASKYRASIDGLSFPDIMDLSYHQELSPVDSMKKLWTIVFEHLSNSSIPFKAYSYFLNNKKEKVIIDESFVGQVPEGTKIYKVSKFEDFMQKTSVVDLQFLLWKLLCATTLDSELLTVTCMNEKHGKVCGHQYSWVYSPNQLLDESSVSEAIMNEMEEVGKADTDEEIKKLFKDSLVNKSNIVELPCSKMKVIFGHMSAYDFITKLFPAVQDLIENSKNQSEMYLTGILQCIKAFLIPKDDQGNYMKISNPNLIIKTYKSLNEIDSMALVKIIDMVLEPYSFKYMIKGAKCPKCKHKQDIDVGEVQQLLFLVSQALEQTQIILKRT